jgi:NAD(P)-dependent dehydrogenase (short-subunit alcohol dehydrogenase family)
MRNQQNGKLTGKVAVVTGAGTGIGKAIALLFAEQDASLVLCGRTLSRVEETADMINENGGVATAIKTDVSNATEVEEMIKKTVDSFGKVDILCNNAGVMEPLASALDLTEEDWDNVLNTNLKSVFLCSKYAIPAMNRNGNGAIVNIASVHGLVRIPGCSAYGASKAGIILYTKQLATEQAKQNIRVNCICPGLIESGVSASFIPALQMDYIPMGRAGQPEDVAQAALFLASDDSKYITGASLVVDGGWTAEVQLPLKDMAL